MRKTWAIARNLISEALRMKVAVSFLVLLTAILVSLPLLMKGDGTLAGRVQTFLSYSFWSLGFILGMLTIFVACNSLAADVADKHVYLSATKPIARWQILLGKWVGVAVLDLVLLVVGGGMIFGTVSYMRTLPGTHDRDHQVLETEVLTSRAGVRVRLPVEEFNAAIERQIERLREEGRLSAGEADAQRAVREQKYAELVRDFRTVEPGFARSWLFEDLRVARDPQRLVHVRYKFSLSREPPLTNMRFFWLFGDRGKGARQYRRDVEDPQDQVRSVEVPADAIGNDGSLLVTLVNRDPDDPSLVFPARITFEGPRDLELLYKVGTFPGNFARALAIIYCRLLFLAVLGLFAASFLGFPVACLVSFTVYFAASLSGFIGESIQMIPELQNVRDPFEYLSLALKPIVIGFMWFIPRLSDYDPIGTLIDGRVVTLRWVLMAIAQLVLIRTTVVGVIAVLIFRRRELAEVIV